MKKEENLQEIVIRIEDLIQQSSAHKQTWKSVSNYLKNRGKKEHLDRKELLKIERHISQIIKNFEIGQAYDSSELEESKKNDFIKENKNKSDEKIKNKLCGENQSSQEKITKISPYENNDEPNFILKSDFENLSQDNRAEINNAVNSAKEKFFQKLDNDEVKLNNLDEIKTFLEKIIKSQRISEKNFILHMKKYLQQIKNDENQEEIKQLEKEINDFEKSEGMDYENFISLLNRIELGSQQAYKNRLEQQNILIGISEDISTIITELQKNNITKQQDGIIQEIMDAIEDKGKFNTLADLFSFILHELFKKKNIIPENIELEKLQDLYKKLFKLEDLQEEGGGTSAKDLLKKFSKQELINLEKENKEREQIQIVRHNMNLSKIDEAMSIIRNAIFYELGDKFASTGSINMADDATFYFDIQTQKNPLEAFQKINKQLAKDRQDPSKFRQTLKQKNEDLRKLKALQGGFMIHESDKYYEEIASGAKKGRLTGRTMNLFNYISSMDHILTSMGEEWWNEKEISFLALNSYKEAIASETKEPLQRIFAIVAGLIMFDDFLIAAKEYLQKEIGDTQHVHLYKVQDLYFPSSYFLTQTYIFFDGNLQESKNRLTTTINWGNPIGTIEKNTFNITKESLAPNRTHQAGKSLFRYTKENGWSLNPSASNLPKWEERGMTERHSNVSKYDMLASVNLRQRTERAKKEVEVQIHFFKEFYNFISALLNKT